MRKSRLLANLLLLTSLIFFPWYVLLAVAMIGLVAFPYFFEAAVAVFLLESFYAPSRETGLGGRFGLLLALTAFVLVLRGYLAGRLNLKKR